MTDPVDKETATMIADYMEAGFLDNIVEMLRQDPGLFPVIPLLVNDERGRVRLGAAALVETLVEEWRSRLVPLIPGIGEALAHALPTVRADAAYILGLIGHGDALPFLENARNDDAPPVRQIIEETIAELSPPA